MLSFLLVIGCAPAPVEGGHLPSALAEAPAPKSVGSTPTTLTGAGSGDFDVVGDVDNDGDDDLVALSGTSASYFPGRPRGIATTASRTLMASFGAGAVVTGAGDVNGDGYGDVAIGDPSASSGAGRVLVYHGTSRGLSTRSSTTLSGRGTDALGSEAAGLGDVNGDGYDDLAVYIPGPTRVRVYYGSSTGIRTTGYTSLSTPWHDVSSIWPYDAVSGSGIAGAGDVNGDGYADLVVSYPTWNTEDGGFYVYLGASSGISTSGTLVSYPWPGSYNSWCDGPPYMGWALAGGFDMNADGYDDVVASAPYDICDGYVYAWFGGASGITTSTWVEFYGYPYINTLGATLDVGDFDGDGVGDIAFGGSSASWAEGPFATSTSTSETMTAPTTISGTTDLSGSYYSPETATRVATGDVNGDGHSDVAAAYYTAAGTWELSVFYGAP